MIEVDLHRVYFIRDNVDDVDIKSLKNDCLKSFKENNRMSKDISDTRNEDLIIPKSKPFEELINIIKDKFYIRYNQVIELTDYWAQVHSQNESTNMHDHVNCFDIKNSPDLSGVYYLEVPRDSGDIVFQWPINKYNQYKRWWFKPKKGDLLIFPSTLDHFVTKNTAVEKRIAVSFNFKILQKSTN
jgi:hypothetical protein|tara:strand:+ start:879 stop:1433 length:555 start_codon:yes stop_codon:yes gene_type:complete